MDFTINKDFQLTEEQNGVCEFLSKRAQAVNASGTGLGKTYATCTLAVKFMTVHPEYKCIIVCPGKANKAFDRELTTKLGESYSIFTATSVIYRPESRFAIFNYTSIKKFYNDLITYKGDGKVFFICDEAHCMQDNKTSIYTTMKAVLSLGKVRWFLTATPLKNDLMGLYWMVEILSPGYLGSQYWFQNRYMVMENVTMTIRGQKRQIPQCVGFKNLDELSQVLSNLIIIKKLAFNLHFNYRSVDIEPQLLDSYSKCAKGIEYQKVNRDGSTERRQRDWGARLHDIQKVLDNCHPEFKGVPLSAKEKDLCYLVYDVLQRGESVLIYCEYYDTIDRVERVLTKLKARLGISNIFRITGKEKTADRASVEDRLVPKSVVLVTRAGCESINLQKSNNVVFYDIPFAINDVIQMVGRVARMDSTYSDMNVYFIEYKKTLDTYKRSLIQAHSTLIDRVICHDTNLPLEVLELDTRTIKEMKQKLVWRFRK